jgi:putative aldouronate transport system substrate-binding protein
MKNFTRTLALATSVMLMLAMLAACGTGTPQATVAPTAAPATSASASASAEPVETGTPAPVVDTNKVIKISMTCQGNVAVDPNAKYLKIMEDKYHIDLDMWQCYGEEYVNQVNAKIAGGEIADIFYMGGGLSVPDYVDQGIIIEMPESFIQQNMPKYYADLYSVSKDPFKYCRLNGKNYGIPGTSADGFYHFTIIWRSDWLKAVGIEKTPETIAEFEDAFYKFANNDPDGNGKKDTYGLSNLGMIPVFGAFGCIPYNNRPDALGEYLTEKDGKIVSAAAQPEMKEALKLIAKWYKDGVVDPEFVTGERKEGHWSSSQAFCGGRIGYTSCGQYYNTATAAERGGADGKVYKMFKETQASLGNTNAAYVHGRPPIGPDGKSGAVKWGVEEGVGFAFGKPLANDTEKQLRIAMWFDDLWMTQDNYMSAIYGIKGEDWTQDPTTGALSVGLSPDTKNSFGPDATVESPAIGLGYMFLPDIVSAMKKETPVAYAFADKVANYPGCGYMDAVANAPLESRAKYYVDLAKITLTAYYDMISGKKDIDTYFDQYVNEWMAAGGSEVLTEANAWWAANNAAK